MQKSASDRVRKCAALQTETDALRYRFERVGRFENVKKEINNEPEHVYVYVSSSFFVVVYEASA